MYTDLIHHECKPTAWQSQMFGTLVHYNHYKIFLFVGLELNPM